MEKLILSSIELYYSPQVHRTSRMIMVDAEESSHILSVMRHKIDDEIYITDGEGKIFKSKICSVESKNIQAKILEEYLFQPKFPSITFCIPKLRSSERFEFAIEKSTELGITNFIFYNAKRSVSKKINEARIKKIIISAMKQSLLSWLPKIQVLDLIDDIINLSGEKILFDQNADKYFERANISLEKNTYFIFGPEGGFTESEMSKFENRYRLAENRLRTETAVVKAASLL